MKIKEKRKCKRREKNVTKGKPPNRVIEFNALEKQKDELEKKHGWTKALPNCYLNQWLGLTLRVMVNNEVKSTARRLEVKGGNSYLFPRNLSKFCAVRNSSVIQAFD